LTGITNRARISTSALSTGKLSLFENQKRKVEEEEVIGMKDSKSKFCDTKAVKICIVFTHQVKNKCRYKGKVVSKGAAYIFNKGEHSSMQFFNSDKTRLSWKGMLLQCIFQGNKRNKNEASRDQMTVLHYFLVVILTVV
jgi:hypothetical protein